MTEVQTDCKDSGVPNQPKTPNTVVRLAPELREPLEREAQERGLYLSDVIREACQEHIAWRELGATWRGDPEWARLWREALKREVERDE